MKLRHVILIVIGTIFALMVGSFLFGISCGLLNQEHVMKEIERMYAHRFITFFISLILFYLSYDVTKTMIKRATREEIFIAEGDFGRVSVSLIAVRDIVQRILRKYDNVKKYRLYLNANNKKLALTISVKEWAGESIVQDTESLRQELKSKLEKITGLADNVEVLIKIKKIADVQA